jgi:hypothetical protein
MHFTDTLPATAVRVEQSTAPEINEAIRERTDAELMQLENASDEDIDTRLQELEREWDVERVLQLNASIFSGLGVALGATVDRRFLLLSVAVYAFFAQHALQGWCPPIPLFRRLGVRTVREIERERHAVKALRGDYDRVGRARSEDGPTERVRAALAAVDA